MTDSGEYDITFLQLPDLDADYDTPGTTIFSAVQEDVLAAGFTDLNKIYLVYYGGSSSGTFCGLGPMIGSGDPISLIILKGECRDRQFTSDLRAPKAVNFWLSMSSFIRWDSSTHAPRIITQPPETPATLWTIQQTLCIANRTRCFPFRLMQARMTIMAQMYRPVVSETYFSAHF